MNNILRKINDIKYVCSIICVCNQPCTTANAFRWIPIAVIKQHSFLPSPYQHFWNTVAVWPKSFDLLLQRSAESWFQMKWLMMLWRNVHWRLLGTAAFRLCSTCWAPEGVMEDHWRYIYLLSLYSAFAWQLQRSYTVCSFRIMIEALIHSVCCSQSCCSSLEVFLGLGFSSSADGDLGSTCSSSNVGDMFTVGATSTHTHVFVFVYFPSCILLKGSGKCHIQVLSAR